MISTLFSITLSILSSYPFLMIVNLISLILKTFIFIGFLKYAKPDTHNRKDRLFLILLLIAAIIEDLSWILLLGKILFFPGLTGILNVAIGYTVKISWTFYAIEYLVLSIFIEKISLKRTPFLNLEKNFSYQ